MKKFNSIIALIVVFTLIGHILTTLIFLLTGFRIELLNNIFARSTYVLMLLHILISIIILIKNHDAKPGPVKYPQNVYRVLIQRASGIVMILLLHAHISQMVIVLRELPMEPIGKLRFCIINILFFASIFLHIAVSFSRPFISFGWMVNTATIKKTDKTVSVLSIICFVVIVASLISFIVGY